MLTAGTIYGASSCNLELLQGTPTDAACLTTASIYGKTVLECTRIAIGIPIVTYGASALVDCPFKHLAHGNPDLAALFIT